MGRQDPQDAVTVTESRLLRTRLAAYLLNTEGGGSIASHGAFLRSRPRQTAHLILETYKLHLHAIAFKMLCVGVTACDCNCFTEDNYYMRIQELRPF